MEDNNISTPLPMPQAKAEDQSPTVPVETQTTATTPENLRANGSMEEGGKAGEDGGDGESGCVFVGPDVTIWRKRGRPRKNDQLGSSDFSASPVSLGPKRGRGRPLAAANCECWLPWVSLVTQLEETSLLMY